MQDMTRAVGRYEILSELGRGGMATVFLARQIDLARLVALKELAALRMPDASFAQRFLREARVAGSLSHPNIVTVYDYLQEDGTPYIAMEYVERGSLRPHVGSLTLAQIGGVLEGILAGLAHAERQGIVHRDLKPENIMITSDGAPKIADFGIAKATNTVRTTAALTSTGTAIGTPNYMAPEQALAEDVGPWTDLYALGIMTFELVVGRLPYAGTDEPMAILLRQINEPITPPIELVPDLDPRLSDWIEQLAAKEPAERPQSAAEAWDGLEPILIDLLGPRWRRDSPLPQLAPGVAFVPGPATPPPVGAPTGPLTEADLPPTEKLDPSFFQTPPTRPLEDRWSAATVPPQSAPGVAQAAANASDEGRRKRPVVGRFAAGIAIAALVLVVAVALAAQHGSSPSAGSTPAAQTGAPTSQTTAPTTQPTDSTAVNSAQQAQSSTSATPQGDLAAKAQAASANAGTYESAAASVAALPGGSGQGPIATLATALRQTASDYRAAAAAAGQNDQAGYTAAIAAVGTDRSNVQSAMTQVQASSAAQGGSSSQSGSSSSAPQQAPQTQAPQQQGGSCAGDSSSDDPSDDSCGSSGSNPSNPSNPPNPPNPPTPPTPPSNP